MRKLLQAYVSERHEPMLANVKDEYHYCFERMSIARLPEWLYLTAIVKIVQDITSSDPLSVKCKAVPVKVRFLEPKSLDRLGLD